MADDHDHQTQADRLTPDDPDALERLMRADGSAWRAWVQPSVERLEARIHAMSASDSLWARLAPRLEPRDPTDAAREAMDGYHVSPLLREIELEDIVGTDSDTDRQLHTIRSTRLDADWTRGRRRLFAILAPVAAVLLLAALVGALLAQQGRTPTASIPTVIQRGQLTWQRVSLPEGLVFGSRGVGFFPSPSDGDTAYVCATSPNKPSAHPRMWVTHDRALHWSRLADVPTTRNANGCDLGVDQVDPRVLTVTAYPAGADSGALVPPEQWQQFVSADGGKTWSSYTDVGSVFLLAGNNHATWQGKTYATRYLLPLAKVPQTGLFVSDDLMHTWTEIDGPILSSPAMRALPASSQQIFRVLVHPSTGELLAVDESQQLWDSRDEGAHWTQLAVPIQAPAGQSAQGDQYAPYQPYIAPPAAGQPWHICALGQQQTAEKDTSFPFACTRDGGKTWQTRLGLFFPNCGGCSAQDGTSHPGAATPVGMLADGTVFGDDSLQISRLPPDATSESEWVQLGGYPWPGGSNSSDQINRSQAVTPSGGLALWVFYKDGVGYSTTLPAATVVTVKVPNFVGMQLRDAQTLAQQDHLKVVVNFVMDVSHPRNLVLDQSPAVDTSVRQDTELTLTVSAGDGRVTVPDVVGKAAGDACLTLSDAGLTCNIPADGRLYSQTVPLGHVIKTDPKAGTVIDLSAPNANTTVNIYVSLGPPPATATPHG